MKIYIRTHGCRLNSAESRWIAEELSYRGFEIADTLPERCDAVIVNTCAVTNESESKCLQTLRQLHRKYPTSLLIVTGCLAEKSPELLLKNFNNILILGNSEKHHLPNHLVTAFGDSTYRGIKQTQIEKSTFCIGCHLQQKFNQRYNLKIQEGCDFFCSYCIIPHLRGRSRSREFNDILEDARMHVDFGVKELVLTGVNIGMYTDNGKNLSDLIYSLNKLAGVERIRISSIEFKTIPDGVIEQMADQSNKLVKYLHLPMQSGSNRILKLMRRHYTAEEYGDYVRFVADQIPGVGLGTDIIVGFPGESEHDYENSVKILSDLPLQYSHVFSFSVRNGTVASLMQNEFVDQKEIARRSANLRRISAEKRFDWYKSFVGHRVEVLLEDYSGGVYPGLTENYARVEVSSEEIGIENTLQTVEITDINKNCLIGKIIL